MKYRTVTYILAVILATLFAAGMAGMGQIFKHSMLPPMGGGWKLTIATPVITWIVVFLLVLMDRKAHQPRKFSLGRQNQVKNQHEKEMPTTESNTTSG